MYCCVTIILKRTYNVHKPITLKRALAITSIQSEWLNVYTHRTCLTDLELFLFKASPTSSAPSSPSLLHPSLRGTTTKC